ncbi:ETX/MTX2 family pore-forming toxin [Bacillus toyonensis]|uniref:ETX/MTX2 family pore-forming toxin n=1 Tax=Bacillus toyonensis TaxID=155322 RepID=UPI001C73D929|nr:ETX/MTX2 family pore-forming toxin [Bacillus toyonensis]MBX0352940.1 ETX/MTX2 family pore-forming toxin [Bacillus toyonensis]
MKRYKKLLMVAPLACMLGTGIFALPNATHADTNGTISAYEYGKSHPDFKTNFTKENLAHELGTGGLRYAIENTPELRQKFKIADGERIQFEQGATILNGIESPATNYGLRDQLSKMEIGAKGSTFSVNPTIDGYEDLGQTNLLTINNDDGIVAQTATTPEVTESYTESMTYSNQYGMKLGIGSKTTFKVNLPFNLGEASQEININTEFSYNHTDSNTSTKQKTVSFKSQQVIAAPGGTTTYYGTVKKAKFSGTFQTDAYLSGVTLKLPIVKMNENLNVVHTEEATLTAEDIYTIYKNRPQSVTLPSYLSLDDQNKKVIMKNAPFTFNGEGGYYTATQVKFIPKDSNKPAQVMPYKEYVAKAQEKSL